MRRLVLPLLGAGSAAAAVLVLALLSRFSGPQVGPPSPPAAPMAKQEWAVPEDVDPALVALARLTAPELPMPEAREAEDGLDWSVESVIFAPLEGNGNGGDS